MSNKTVISALIISIQQCTGHHSWSHKARGRKNIINTEKKKVKLFLFVEYIIIYTKNSNLQSNCYKYEVNFPRMQNTRTIFKIQLYFLNSKS